MIVSPETEMRWGVHLPQIGSNSQPDTIMRYAQTIEELGFDSAWVSDHLAYPEELRSRYPYRGDGKFPAGDRPFLDPLTTLTFVSGVTSRLQLGTSVLVLGLRHPLLLAKQVATVDRLSGGRLILGLGVGWMREEFDLVDVPFESRGERADEQLDVLRVLQRNPAEGFHGKHYDFGPIIFEPRVPGDLRIWVGGATKPAYVRAARNASGFHAAFDPLPVLHAHGKGLEAACAAVGRDPADLTVSARWYLDPGGIASADTSLFGTPDHMVAQIELLREAGIRYMVLDPVAQGPIDRRLDALAEFSVRVLPQLN